MTTREKTKVPTTMTELRDDLLQVYHETREGMIKLPLAKEAANVAGKIIKSSAVQLEYAVARKETPSIPFLK